MAAMIQKSTLGELPLALIERGWAHMGKTGAGGMKRIIQTLGTLIQVTDVMVKRKANALVTTSQAMDFHSDHSRADYVAWHCLESAESGGESVIVDAEAAYALLEETNKKQLRKIRIAGHLIFPGDRKIHPLLSITGGKRKFYYSPWLADATMPPPQRRAFNAFRRAIDSAPKIEIKLRRGEVLVVDNNRVFHGRRSFGGKRQRHLKRYWIQSSR